MIVKILGFGVKSYFNYVWIDFTMKALLLFACLITQASSEKVIIGLIAPPFSDAHEAARLAVRNYTNEILLVNSSSKQTKPYQFAQHAADLLANQPYLATGLVTVTSSTEAATAVAAATYQGQHANAFVAPFNLNLNIGTASGIRTTASAKNMAIATAGLLQKYGFQKYTVLASSEYSSMGNILSERMKLHFQTEDGLLDTTVGANPSYVFRSGNSTKSHLEITALIHQLKMDTTRVVVLLCSQTDAFRVLPLAYEAGIIKKGWTWTGLGWFNQQLLTAGIVPNKALVGMLGLVPAPWNFQHSDVYAYTYDAVLTLVKAAIAVKEKNPTVDSSSDMKFCKLTEEYAISHTINGMTGPVAFDHDDDEDDVTGDPYDDRGSRESPSFAGTLKIEKLKIYFNCVIYTRL